MCPPPIFLPVDFLARFYTFSPVWRSFLHLFTTLFQFVLFLTAILFFPYFFPTCFLGHVGAARMFPLVPSHILTLTVTMTEQTRDVLRPPTYFGQHPTLVYIQPWADTQPVPWARCAPSETFIICGFFMLLPLRYFVCTLYVSLGRSLTTPVLCVSFVSSSFYPYVFLLQYSVLIVRAVFTFLS